MHIGSTSVFEGKVSYQELIKHIEDRLHLIPRYLQKVVPDPFNLGHPTWESAENFDIKQHIIEVKTKKALTHKDLIKLAGETLTMVLDRNKPLWELHIITNVEGGRSAMVAKVHHCMVDGISGVDLIKIMFDISPNSAPPPPKPEAQPKKPKLDATQQLFDSVIGVLQEGVNRITELQGGLMYMSQALANPQTIGALPHLSQVLPAITAPAPNLPFNGECSGERRLAWSEFSFAEARAIRANLGGSVNDVVLTLLSESVARYVKFHKEETDGKIVRFMVPVSLRQEEKRGALGNMISVLPVEIPLDIVDLRVRFKTVNQKTAVMKAAKLAEGLGIFGALYGMMPAQLQSIIGAVAELPFPPFNMVATNVPGPQIPLYMCGKKMLAHYPYVPIGYRLGLGCAIFSYNQTLYFGLSSDAKAMSDVEKFKEILDETFADLKRAAGIETESASAAGAEK